MEPGWLPSADLAQKFRRKLARLKVMGLRRDNQWDNLVDFVKQSGFDDEADLEMAWTIVPACPTNRLAAASLTAPKP